MALTKRSTKGSAITAAENDANFDHVLARGNHTGSQAISTVSGLQTALDGKATSAQGAKADTAVQPGNVVATIDTQLGSTTWQSGGTGGSTTLLGLTDVPDTAAEGDIAVYRSGTFVFEAKPTASGSPAWGDITGTLTSQTDLQTALNGKAPMAHGHSIDDITGHGSAALAETTDFATAAQGALANSAVQPSPAAGNNLTAGAKVWEGTQAAYDAIATKDSNTLYFVTG